MSTGQRPPRALHRAGLSRERVLGAAVALADEGGLDGLSMRKLARSLGVEAMSLYNHVASKERLLDGMIDLVFAEVDAPSADGDWREQMRRRATSTRAALNRHPWAVGLMEARPSPGEPNMRLHEAVLACLRQAGFSVGDAIHAYSVQDAYIYGFALQEQTLSHPTREEWVEVANRILRDFAPVLDAYPRSAEVQHHIAAHGFSHEEEFLFGLELILDGLEQRLAAARANGPAG
jgi:AcrR family transcriptional regulator